MPAARIYLDHNATTPLHAEARARMLPLLDERFGNPSSIHQDGRRARTAIERARKEVADLVAATPETIVFVSSGTEACNLAVRGAAWAARGRTAEKRHVVVSAIEHP